MSPVVVATTARLVLRELSAADAAFMLELLNEPAWHHYIGDKGVRTLADAEAYIATGPQKLYREHGFGLWLVESRVDATPLGICGLLKRPNLDDVDIGFAFLARHWGRGYAHEAATATIDHARHVVKLRRLVALTALENPRSIRLLEKLGLRFERFIRFQPGGHESRLFAMDLATSQISSS